MANDHAHADGARSARRRDTVAALLELAAADDAVGFRAVLDAAGCEAAEPADEVELWYGRSKAWEPRTPLMVAAACGSKGVVALLLDLRCVDVNGRPGTDGVTALHCAASGGSPNAVAVIKSLLAAGADPAIPDSAGRVPADVIQVHPTSPDTLARLVALLGRSSRQFAVAASVSLTTVARSASKREYPADPTLPDLNSGAWASDDHRIFRFKVEPCIGTYQHDWTMCPYAHPGKNARRRNPSTHVYTAGR